MFAESARLCRHANIHELPREAYGVREFDPAFFTSALRIRQSGGKPGALRTLRDIHRAQTNGPLMS